MVQARSVLSSMAAAALFLLVAPPVGAEETATNGGGGDVAEATNGGEVTPPDNIMSQTNGDVTTNTTAAPAAVISCDICGGRGGRDVVESEARDLKFIPAVAQYGTALGFDTCDKFVTNVDTLVGLLADEKVATGILNLDAAIEPETSCRNFQKLGVYCGCAPATPTPCSVCRPGEGELINPDAEVVGTAMEELVQYRPTCGFFEEMYTRNVAEGTEDCEWDREEAKDYCVCSGSAAATTTTTAAPVTTTTTASPDGAGTMSAASALNLGKVSVPIEAAAAFGAVLLAAL
uniref:Uncharacterized protein n=1 Tax=Pseudictyota dubia TaxID=2749911 RepID=A0A7R9W408_9STRA|mmetsp:Transcript_32597/g.59942  ORF Transcript_32597/g.59942 Transcript_32597/m.59942 type:complete len:290 (+) Transcript_32597:253-1122(+)